MQAEGDCTRAAPAAPVTRAVLPAKDTIFAIVQAEAGRRRRALSSVGQRPLKRLLLSKHAANHRANTSSAPVLECQCKVDLPQYLVSGIEDRAGSLC